MVEIQILLLLIVLSTPNQYNNRKILHLQFINRERRNFTGYYAWNCTIISRMMRISRLLIVKTQKLN